MSSPEDNVAGGGGPDLLFAVLALAAQPSITPPEDLEEVFENWGKSDAPSAHMSCLLGDFRMFFIEMYPRLVIFLKAKVRDEHLAEDIAQETFLIVLRKWPLVCRADQPAAYVTTIAVRLVGKLRLPEKAFDLPLEQPSRDAVDDKIVNKILLEEALLQLTPRQSEIIIRSYLMDQDVKTIARELGLAPSTVRVHRFAGLKALRSLLRPYQAPVPERKT